MHLCVHVFDVHEPRCSSGGRLFPPRLDYTPPPTSQTLCCLPVYFCAARPHHLVARRRSTGTDRMVVICRRHAAWSIATFTDGLFTNFVLPFGPLLLLSHLELSSYRQANTAAAGDPLEAQEQEDGAGAEAIVHWAVVAKLWSQVCRGEGTALHNVGVEILLQPESARGMAAAKPMLAFFPHGPARRTCPTLSKPRSLGGGHAWWLLPRGTGSPASVPSLPASVSSWGAHVTHPASRLRARDWKIPNLTNPRFRVRVRLLFVVSKTQELFCGAKCAEAPATPRTALQPGADAKSWRTRGIVLELPRSSETCTKNRPRRGTIKKEAGGSIWLSLKILKF